MSRFTTEGLPRPVLVQPLDFETQRQLRLDEYLALMAEEGIDVAGDNHLTSSGGVAARAAGHGDVHFVARLNDTARAVLLPSFATLTDLDRQAERAGIARLAGEDDEPLRERIRLAWKSKSAAGPDDYYKSAARNHDARVKDVEVTAETRDFSDRVLIVSVLTVDNGGLLDDALKASLESVLNDPSFRSRNVTVEVVPAVISTKNVFANIYLYPETPLTVIGEASTALSDMMLKDQRLGFDLTRSYVEKHLHRAGVQRVELQGWTNAYADFNEAVRIGTINLTPIRLAS